MKGIIVTGHKNIDLYPFTNIISKELLPIYDKPMIYYAISTLMLGGIKEILIIATSQQDIFKYQQLLGIGERFGIELEYAIMHKSNDVKQNLLSWEKFIDGDKWSLIFGDNIFYGNDFYEVLKKSQKAVQTGEITILGYYVENPEKYEIIKWNKEDGVYTINMKSDTPTSNYAVTGLYFFPDDFLEKVKQVKFLSLEEFKVNIIKKFYMEGKKLNVQFLGRGFTWFNVKTVRDLYEVSKFIYMIENRQNIIVSAPEEIAYRYRWINKQQLLESAALYGKSLYGEHLKSVILGKMLK